MQKIALLGSTGSIGTQTLEVIEHLPDYEVFGLSAGSNTALLQEQAAACQPKLVAMADKDAAFTLQRNIDTPVLGGQEGLCELAAHPAVDIVVMAVVGSAGVAPTLAALEAGKRVALANKETLVAAGHLVMQYKEQIIPIDSEHSALWQCLDGRDRGDAASLVLTASGGPFHDYQGDFQSISIAQALKHPNWSMGGKITIDSATLMNKGLEVIEAHWLFGIDYPAIEVIVHPESMIHSLVRFRDGSLLAQMATTDMRLPIQYALTYPDVRPSLAAPLDLWDLPPLHFEKPNTEQFPCLALAYEAGRTGGTMPTCLNAANEVAVDCFLRSDIGFMDIPTLVREMMAQHTPIDLPNLQQIFEVDATTREQAFAWVERHRGRMNGS